jgi:hypothetical protein
VGFCRTVAQPTTMTVCRATRWVSALLLIAAFVGDLDADHEEPTGYARAATGFEMLSAFRAGYPAKAGEIKLTRNRWSIGFGGAEFYWADGKLIGPDSLALSEQFTPHPFYRYPDRLPELSEPTTEQKRSIEARVAHREENPPTRDPGIYNAIWRVVDEPSAWNQAKTAFFFGRKLLIHRDLLDELASVEEELLSLVGDGDHRLDAYIRSLGRIEGYSWRPIAGTASLSYHSYGAAIDFVPRSTAGKETYWRWARERYPEWYALPYDRRLMPPESFVSAFEKRGFIWGGKWFYFDTMHFEYRPEILALNGYVRVLEESRATGIREWIWVRHL